MISKNKNELLRDYQKLIKKFMALSNYSSQTITPNVDNFFSFINENENISPFFKLYLEDYEKFVESNPNIEECAFNPPAKDEYRIKYALAFLKQLSSDPITSDDILFRMVIYVNSKKFAIAYERCFELFVQEPLSNVFEDIEYTLREKDVVSMPTTINNNFNAPVSHSQFGNKSVQYNNVEDNSVIQQIENLGISLTEDNRKIINEIQNELNKENTDKDNLKGKCLSLVTNGSKELLIKTMSTIANSVLNNVGEEILKLFN